MNLFEKTDCDTIWFDAAFRRCAAVAAGARYALRRSHAARRVVSRGTGPSLPLRHALRASAAGASRRAAHERHHGAPSVVAPQGMLSVSDAYHNVPEWHGTYPIFRAWGEMTSVFFIPSMEPFPTGRAFKRARRNAAS